MTMMTTVSALAPANASVADPPDSYSKAGAERLAAIIIAYWARLGRPIVVGVQREAYGDSRHSMWVVRLPPTRVPTLEQTKPVVPAPSRSGQRHQRTMPWAGHNARILTSSIPAPGGGRAPAIATMSGPRVMLPPGWGSRRVTQEGSELAP